MNSGLYKASLASSSTALVCVAEKSTVCRSLLVGTAARILRSSPSKPASSRRSASSSTSMAHADRSREGASLPLMPTRWSSSRPGVAITNLPPTTLVESLAASPRRSWPPIMRTGDKDAWAARSCLAVPKSCMASSRVGTSTSSRTARDASFSSSAARMYASRPGRRNARDLPDPVGAWPARSVPPKMSGIALRWISVKCLKDEKGSLAASTACNDWCSGSDENGFGIFLT
mmetsp:Transcript_13717/g.43147  ORF Transcript_13717/g.43147 Transcript_13717/m.43147 type:complete len:231 (+) Transcript_13717:1155-1847(+)